MIRNNLKPVLTLYHWDLPSVLQDELTPNGWLNDEIVDHFVEYATLIFQELGQKLDYWTTFNEPSTFIKNGYGTGTHAPGFTNSSVNGYIVTHNVMRSHTKAVQKFREFRNSGVVRPTARIGIVLVSQMMYPLDPSNIKDVAAAERALQFDYGVYLQPMISGDYPAVMREVVGNRLPKITAEESALVKGSYDLFMMKLFQVCNRLQTSCDSLSLGYAKDRGVAESRAPEGYRNSSRNSAGELNCAWFTAYPPGYLALMKWVSAHDPSAEMMLTENGWYGNEEIYNQDQMWYYKT
ncbi:Strictosidine-O-beta-D-glucosidase [Phytophthora citrophthora]|uniref:Strictosidine-O-beta-D-glucosidase n=1 Tax=Phytophthora citrophthora TaxID=4793 RepID=A0AAD9GB89_9STRA|nr:Strictosidine-O-beta-D-glucosidase [Phytophthora citrophthora]